MPGPYCFDCCNFFQSINQPMSLIIEAAWYSRKINEGEARKPGFSRAAKSLQSCLTLCDPIDGSPPGSSTPGILQARTLEWVAISFSNACKCKVKVKSLSHVQLLATPWTAAHQAPPSMGFSRQEYWSGVPLPSPGSLLAWCKLERHHEFWTQKWAWSSKVLTLSVTCSVTLGKVMKCTEP